MQPPGARRAGRAWRVGDSGASGTIADHDRFESDILSGPLQTLLAVVLWSVLHSVLAADRVKARLRRRFGSLYDRGYRLAYNLISVLTLLPLLAVAADNPGTVLYRIPAPWVYLTLAAQALAGLLILVALLQTGLPRFLGLRQLLEPDRQPRAQLQVTGVYRWIRHPLYTSGLVVIWLSPLMTISLLVLYLGFTAYIWIGSRIEEQRLETDFGEAYRRYRRQVPAFLPVPGRHWGEE